MLTPTSRGAEIVSASQESLSSRRTITALSAGPAPAQEGAPGFEIKDELAEVKAEGPGFETKRARMACALRSATRASGTRRPASRSRVGAGPRSVGLNLRPFACENGTYRLVSGI